MRALQKLQLYARTVVDATMCIVVTRTAVVATMADIAAILQYIRSLNLCYELIK